ncbi:MULTISPECIES: Crp/Fnr family transcriptional regulator [Gracilibacillus]|uniref:Crp/Fnr family transcriptional regulator n=1 Tax=Gracilibacillus dipsosauri TaxID=178340 RepID=A0A317KW94_9BACI|nr:Crp/Fnr family transcriptional regulator [Gracilibacillus dipsosauri]PWU67626.1 hypothetical protein DLJ74_14310 [Gracilibacillus dipsosauri]
MSQTSTPYIHFPLFQNLTEDELIHLSEISMERSYNQGKILFHQDESRTNVYFILSGLVKMIKINRNGHEQILHVLHTNDMFPYVGFFENVPYPSSAIALTNVHVLSIPIKEFELLLIQKPGLLIKVIRIIEKNYQETQDRLLYRQTQDVFHQVVLILVHFVCDLGIRQKEDTIQLHLPITNSELANMIGVSRESVNRVFNQLKKTGIMTYNRKEILIYDFWQLKQYLQD